jgi:hypothetical protein
VFSDGTILFLCGGFRRDSYFALRSLDLVLDYRVVALAVLLSLDLVLTLRIVAFAFPAAVVNLDLVWDYSSLGVGTVALLVVAMVDLVVVALALLILAAAAPVVKFPILALGLFAAASADFVQPHG